MKTFIDQMKREVILKGKPKRIISLVPSQTELLFSLGLEKETIAITKFCVHPKEWRKKKEIIGGTKKLNLDKISKLNPDLIIGNKEENKQEDIEWLSKNHSVWMSDIYNITDSLKMIECIGKICDKEKQTQKIINSIKEELIDLDHFSKSPIKKALYVIWDNPTMVAGKKTYIDSIMRLININNACDTNRYPNLKDVDIQEPDCIFLSSEPYPFKKKHIQKYRNKFPNSQVILVDGEMFSWYGSRIIKAIPYIKSIRDKLI
tara:strand:- start:1090 stop:1872 length:783 start_codon:yes stop_codon:yes gene_type:complete